VIKLTPNEYQKLAARTINPMLTMHEQYMHALHGMVGEIGELHSIYQKRYQGHIFDEAHAKKELGDLLWFIAEFCSAYGWNIEDIMQLNIDKLRARYPEGFDAEHSLNRKVGDI
jgi:NTP pyrophosphatase (non-canonical NTP hydrolase)